MDVHRRRVVLRDMPVDVHSASAGHGVGGAGWGRPGAERVREVRWALASLLEPRLRASKTEWHRLPFGLCPSLPRVHLPYSSHASRASLAALLSGHPLRLPPCTFGRFL